MFKTMMLIMIELMVTDKTIMIMFTLIFIWTPTVFDEICRPFANHHSWSVCISGNNVRHYAGIGDSNTRHSFNFQFIVDNSQIIRVGAHFTRTSLMILWICVPCHGTLPICITAKFQVFAILHRCLVKLDVVSEKFFVKIIIRIFSHTNNY